VLPFAEPADLAAVWRPLTADEVDVVAAWLDRASQLVRDEVPDVDGFDVDERIEDGSLSHETVRDVVVSMVRRVVVLNPVGARQQGVGPFTVTLDSALSASELYLSARELARLTGQRTVGPKAFTIAPGPGPVFQSRY
jgi:Phage protein Gp19/Gp15/Gp42